MLVTAISVVSEWFVCTIAIITVLASNKKMPRNSNIMAANMKALPTRLSGTAPGSIVASNFRIMAAIMARMG